MRTNLLYSSSTPSQVHAQHHHTTGPLHITKNLAIILAHDLGRLHSIHLLRPPRRRLKLAHSANLVERVAGYANVVVALEDYLNVADVEGRVGPDLGQPAGRGDEVVDEVVGEGQDGLWMSGDALSAMGNMCGCVTRVDGTGQG